MSNYPDKVFLNGEILPSQEAKISVFDRGFLFGDGVYEVMTQFNGSFFYEKEHLDRLQGCLKKINIEYPIQTLKKHIDALLAAVDLSKKDCLLYIQISRGVAPRKHAFPKNIEPTLMMYAIPFKLPNINNQAISVICMEDYRWHRCDIKTTSLLGNVMANTQATNANNYEAIFTRNGLITEASHCNVFFVKDQVVYTHPADENILNGITRKIVIELCIKAGIQFVENAIRKEDVFATDEAFLTGTSTQIASIKNIGPHFYYQNDKAGPITQKLQELYAKLKTN